MKSIILGFVIVNILIVSGTQEIFCKTNHCLYKWEDMKRDSIISIPTSDFPLIGIQLTNEMKGCLMPLIKEMKGYPKYKIWITLKANTGNNERNKRVFEAVYSFLRRNGIPKTRIDASMHIVRPLPSPIIDSSVGVLQPISSKKKNFTDVLEFGFIL